MFWKQRASKTTKTQKVGLLSESQKMRQDVWACIVLLVMSNTIDDLNLDGDNCKNITQFTTQILNVFDRHFLSASATVSHTHPMFRTRIDLWMEALTRAIEDVPHGIQLNADECVRLTSFASGVLEVFDHQFSDQ